MLSEGASVLSERVSECVCEKVRVSECESRITVCATTRMCKGSTTHLIGIACGDGNQGGGAGWVDSQAFLQCCNGHDVLLVLGAAVYAYAYACVYVYVCVCACVFFLCVCVCV